MQQKLVTVRSWKARITPERRTRPPIPHLEHGRPWHEGTRNQGLNSHNGNNSTRTVLRCCMWHGMGWLLRQLCAVLTAVLDPSTIHTGVSLFCTVIFLFVMCEWRQMWKRKRDYIPIRQVALTTLERQLGEGRWGFGKTDTEFWFGREPRTTLLGD